MLNGSNLPAIHPSLFLSRPVSEDVFAVRAGGYGLSFGLPGVDTECLSEEAITVMSNELQTAQRLVPEDFVTYGIARARRRGYVPKLKYTNSSNPTVAETERAREAHLAKIGFRSVELFLTVYAPPPSGLITPGARAESMSELLARLEQVAETLTVNMARFGLKRLNLSEICEVYGYIANLHGNHLSPSSDRLAEELACESIRWNDDGIKVGSRYGKLFSLLKTPKKTHPNLFGELLRIDADMILVLESQRRTADQTRAEVSRQQTFTDIFREKVLTLISYLGDAAAMAAKPKSAASLAADQSVSTLSGVLADLDNGIAYTQTSLIGLVHSEDKGELNTQMAHIHRIAGQSQAVFHQESIGVLSGFASFFPGSEMAGRTTNVRRRWLREDHVRNISLVHAPYIGEPWSEALKNEAHSIFGTRDGTAFHYDPYTEPGHVRGCFVFGPKGTGKSFLLNHIADHELKYGGAFFSFDVGASLEHTVLKHGGKVIRFGFNSPRTTFFALPDTDTNQRFVQRMVKMLLIKAGAIILPTQEREINERITGLFKMERSVRRLKHLILPANLQPYLDKWIEGRGPYGNIFDNVEDELELSKAVIFDFEALGEGPQQEDLMEPLLTWIRWRIASYTRAASNLGVPKLELYDEVWRHMKDQQMLDMILNNNATDRKYRGGMMLATQSAEQLGNYVNLIRTNCPDAIWLGGPIRREDCGIFRLHDRQIELIDSLQMGEFLLTREKYSKVCKLDVDEQSRWLYSTDPNDRVKRNQAIETFGRDEAFRQLVATATAK